MRLGSYSILREATTGSRQQHSARQQAAKHQLQTKTEMGSTTGAQGHATSEATASTSAIADTAACAAVLQTLPAASAVPQSPPPSEPREVSQAKTPPPRFPVDQIRKIPGMPQSVTAAASPEAQRVASPAVAASPPSPTVGVAGSRPAATAGTKPIPPVRGNLTSLMDRLKSIDNQLDGLRIPSPKQSRGHFSRTASLPVFPTQQADDGEAEAVFNCIMDRLTELEEQDKEENTSYPSTSRTSSEQILDCTPDLERSHSLPVASTSSSRSQVEPADLVRALRQFQQSTKQPNTTDQLLDRLILELESSPPAHTLPSPSTSGREVSLLSPSSSKKRVRSGSTSPERPPRSNSVTSMSALLSATATSSPQSKLSLPSSVLPSHISSPLQSKAGPSKSQILAQHKETLTGLIGHLQRLTDALKDATGSMNPQEPMALEPSDVMQSKQDMEEVVNSALAQLSGDLSPTQQPQIPRLSTAQLLLQADLLCGSASKDLSTFSQVQAQSRQLLLAAAAKQKTLTLPALSSEIQATSKAPLMRIPGSNLNTASLLDRPAAGSDADIDLNTWADDLGLLPDANDMDLGTLGFDELTCNSETSSMM